MYHTKTLDHTNTPNVTRSITMTHYFGNNPWLQQPEVPSSLPDKTIPHHVYVSHEHMIYHTNTLCSIYHTNTVYLCIAVRSLLLEKNCLSHPIPEHPHHHMTIVLLSPMSCFLMQSLFLRNTSKQPDHGLL